MRIGMKRPCWKILVEASTCSFAVLTFWILSQVSILPRSSGEGLFPDTDMKTSTNNENLLKFQVLDPSLLHCQVPEWSWSIYARRWRTWWNMQRIHRPQTLPVPPGMVQVEGYSPGSPRSTARRIRSDFPLWVSFWVQHRIHCEWGREFCDRKLDWRRESCRQMHLQVSFIWTQSYYYLRLSWIISFTRFSTILQIFFVINST